MSEEFLYDDFFAPEDDPGMDMEVEVRDRKIPFKVKRGLSFNDFSYAREQAATFRINPATQMPQLLKMDERVFNIELIFRVLRDWPFKHNGEKLPITREAIGEMNADVLQAIVQRIGEVVLKKKDALAPFGSQSAAAS